jgi:act minimal PKS chain-length factor (CLF/KS beta)
MTAVITGIGVAAPTGLGVDDFWRRTLASSSGIAPISLFDASSYPARLAGEVPGFVAAEHITSRLLPQTDRMTRLALAAGSWALADADLAPADIDGMDAGVVTANSSGGFEFGQRELENLWGRGPEYVSAYQSFAWFYAVNTGQLSIGNGMRGPTGVTVSEQAGGLDAIGHARRHLRKGTRLLLTGGMESSICPWGLTAQLTSRRLSHSDDPERAYRPFAADATGCVIGEGGAIMVIEDAEAAERRGAPRRYGEIAGYQATFDQPAASGRPSRLAGAIIGAITDAGIEPAAVDVVFADAAGIPALDRAEALALAEVFGPAGVPVTAPKTMTGRLSSGGAAVDVAAALLAIRDGVIPPTVNVERPADEYELDLVTEPRSVAVRTCLVVARGFGGFNSAMVIRATTAAS